MLLVDHLFVFLLFVVQPIHGALSYKRYLRRIEAGEPANRVRLYRDTLILEWTAFGVLALTWFLLDRQVSTLGFVSSPTKHFAIGATVLALFTAYLLYAWHASKTISDERRANEAKSLGSLVHFLPRNQRELTHFVYLSITAGFVEEIIYRGFVFWYLAHIMPIWAVVLVSSLAFGLGHTYQGIGGVARVFLVGTAFGVFYVLTKSIWLPILAHVILDILQGVTIVELMHNDKQPPVDHSPQRTETP